MDSEEGIPLPKTKDAESRWRRLLRSRLPIVEWAPRYERADAIGDLVAGVTLGLTLVPQSIAYASLADLPVQYGLYSGYIGTMLYVALGTVKEVSIGPTSLMALLTLQTCKGLPIEYVILLSFLSGCLVFLMGLLRLGFLVDLISPAVTSGFTSGTAVIVAVAQVKGLLGLTFTAETVEENLRFILQQRHEIRIPDCLLSLVCCTVLLALRMLKDLKVGDKRVRKVLWVVSISRNVIVVCGATVFAYCTYDPDPGRLLVKLSGRVEPGLPKLSLPPFSVTEGNITVGFVDMVHELGVGLAMMPIVMVLANIAIAKAFTTGGRVDATQEMLTLGICNVFGSLVHAMPTCGAFTRSAVSYSSGVRSPAAGFYSGVITLVALIFMTRLFYFIPKACLSSVLICAVIFMVDIKIVRTLWARNRCELALLALTFVVCLWRSVELAVLVGVLASLLVLLHAVARPEVHVATLKVAEGEVVRIRPTLALVYLNVAYCTQRVLAAAAATATSTCAGAGSRCRVLLDCSALAHIDYTALLELERLIKKFENNDQKLIVYNASPELLSKLEEVPGVCGRALRAPTAAAAVDAVREQQRERLEHRRSDVTDTDTDAAASAAAVALLADHHVDV